MGYATPFFSNGDVDSNIEIRRTKREKGNEVPDRAKRNFRGKQRWNKIFFFFRIVLQYNSKVRIVL